MSPKTTITEKTFVSLPLPVVVTSLVSIIGLAALITAKLDSIEGSIKKLEERSESMWTLQKMALWTRDFQNMNRDINVPLVAVSEDLKGRMPESAGSDLRRLKETK